MSLYSTGLTRSSYRFTSQTSFQKGRKIIMDRRSFLQLMFSLGAAKAVERFVPALPIAPAPPSILYPAGGKISMDIQAWTYTRNFELTASSPAESLSIVVNPNAPF